MSFQEEEAPMLDENNDPVDVSQVVRKAIPALEFKGKPIDIKPQSIPVDKLSEELMPEHYWEWLSDVSHRMQTPPDFVAISSIVMTGSVIGSGCAMRPKAKDNWEVVPNLWGTCVARPSVGLKTPSMQEAIHLLSDLQEKYHESHKSDLKVYEFDNRFNDMMKKDIECKMESMAKGKGKDRVIDKDAKETLRGQYMELEDIDKPNARMFKTNETSIQSMTVLQNQNPRGILTFRDELTGLLTKWQGESFSDERSYFMDGWNGNSNYTDFKIGRNLTHAKNICISLLGGIQPDKLNKYLLMAMNGANDGLMQRFQLAVWPDEPTWALIDIEPAEEAKQSVYKVLETLAEIDFTEYGATDADPRPYFNFTPEGQAVFNKWYTTLHTVTIKEEENPLMVEHLAKYSSLMPSLALIFHLIDVANGEPVGGVSEKAALLAVKWCKYLKTHARRIYSMAENPIHDVAIRLSRKIKSQKLSSPFNAKDVYKNCWSGLNDREEIESACDILIENNWLLSEGDPYNLPGRPPLKKYWINPVLHADP